MQSAKKKVDTILAKADITVNGGRPFDMEVRNDKLYDRVLSGGTVALGEAYMDGWWDVGELDEFFHRALRANLGKYLRTASFLLHVLRAKLFNLQNERRAFRVGEEHYDVGNDLYKRMLDLRMVYTCGYWSGTPKAETLDEAQVAKLDLICRKIGLKKGDRVLDIGCGWGSFAKFAAETYGARVVGVTISKEQKVLAEEMTKGLPVEIRLQDYRSLDEQFDHIVSIGMFEHVGYKNYREYMEVASRCLKDGGLFLLHTIGSNESVVTTDPWIEKYIFPGGMLPSIAQVGKSIEGLFVLEDLHNFGADYDTTLMHWFKNFDAHWDEIKDRYSERFYRMWKYYLLSCAGTFRSRRNQLWQMVLSKRGVPGGYRSIR